MSRPIRAIFAVMVAAAAVASAAVSPARADDTGAALTSARLAGAAVVVEMARAFSVEVQVGRIYTGVRINGGCFRAGTPGGGKHPKPCTPPPRMLGLKFVDLPVGASTITFARLYGRLPKGRYVAWISDGFYDVKLPAFTIK